MSRKIQTWRKKLPMTLNNSRSFFQSRQKDLHKKKRIYIFKVCAFDTSVVFVYIIKKNITRWLKDMNFMFSWQKQYFTSALTREILFLPPEHKIHIFSPPCNNPLYLFPFLIAEPGLIEVSLVLKYTPDVDEEGVLKLGSHAANTTDVDSRGARQIKSSKDNLVDGVINLCSPVQVCIMPKAIR